jgi:hypothetical protein
MSAPFATREVLSLSTCSLRASQISQQGQGSSRVASVGWQNGQARHAEENFDTCSKGAPP